MLSAVADRMVERQGRNVTFEFPGSRTYNVDTRQSSDSAPVQVTKVKAYFRFANVRDVAILAEASIGDRVVVVSFEALGRELTRDAVVIDGTRRLRVHSVATKEATGLTSHYVALVRGSGG